MNIIPTNWRHSRNPEPHYHKGKKRCGEKSLPQGCVENKEIIGGGRGKDKKSTPGRKKRKRVAYLLFFPYNYSILI